MTEAATPTVSDIVADLQRGHFYGSLELKFEAGRVVLIRKTESFKPASEDYRISRGVNEPAQPR
jgi:hypothetical protein